MAVADTCEGSGESFLKQWLNQNRLSSLQNKLLVEAQINEEELLDFALNTNEAIQFCDDYGIKTGLIRKRFINALSTFPAQYAKYNNNGNNNNDNNDNNNAPKLIVATLSKEEEDIINKINKKRKDNKTFNEKIDKLLEIINNKQKLCYNQINNVFNELQKALDNQKSKLQKDLENICNDKKNKLTSSKKKIQENNEKIKKFQLNNTQLLMNWKMDKDDRKQKIIQSGNVIINDNSVSNTFNENISIAFKINKDKAIKFISGTGLIDGIGAPNCPQITINKIAFNNIEIKAGYDDNSGNIDKLQVELCEDNGNIENDAKLQWTEKVFQAKDVNESYKISNIKSKTKYGLRAKIKNKNGWSNYCDIKKFTTANDPSAPQPVLGGFIYNSGHYTVSNNAKTIKKGNKTHCYPSPVYSNQGYNTGVHIWSVKSNATQWCCTQIGITSGQRNTPSKSAEYNYFHTHGGYSYYVGNPNGTDPWKKQNDIVTVTLDCINWKVTICDPTGTILKTEKIQQSQTYYFALSSCGNSADFEIIQ